MQGGGTWRNVYPRIVGRKAVDAVLCWTGSHQQVHSVPWKILKRCRAPAVEPAGRALGDN